MNDIGQYVRVIVEMSCRRHYIDTDRQRSGRVYGSSSCCVVYTDQINLCSSQSQQCNTEILYCSTVVILATNLSATHYSQETEIMWSLLESAVYL